jgi:hypothetical protein
VFFFSPLGSTFLVFLPSHCGDVFTYNNNLLCIASHAPRRRLVGGSVRVCYRSSGLKTSSDGSCSLHVRRYGFVGTKCAQASSVTMFVWCVCEKVSSAATCSVTHLFPTGIIQYLMWSRELDAHARCENDNQRYSVQLKLQRHFEVARDHFEKAMGSSHVE